ncbi:MAG: hypothetical protein ACKPKO_38065, partial [Candidatus Fonsibacter sp.]
MIAADIMKGAIAPIARFVLLKAKVLRERGELLEQHTALINKMKATKSMDDVLAMMPELDRLEDEVDRLSEPLAFKAKMVPTSGPSAWQPTMLTNGLA